VWHPAGSNRDVGSWRFQTRHLVEELYTCGRTEALRTAIGFGMVLWPILRHMGQLLDLYFGAQEVESPPSP
jgi:hypothetical protein